MKKRNSLVELFRFIFAINVVKNHGYFPYKGKYIGPGRISVEFFFILTGYLLVKSVDKYLDKTYWKGLWEFFFHKLKSILIPVAIAIPFNILYCVVAKQSFNIFGYLWYVKQMLIYVPVFFTLRYFIRKDKYFIMTIGLIFLVGTVFNLMPMFYETGIFRSMMGISLGVLISFIPKIKINKPNLLWLAVIPFALATLSIVIFDTTPILERFAHFVIYPGFIYFVFHVKFHSKFLNYLGALSFGLYAFQCVVRPLEVLGLTNVWALFGIIVLFTILEDGIKRIVRFYKNKKKQKDDVSSLELNDNKC